VTVVVHLHPQRPSDLQDTKTPTFPDLLLILCKYLAFEIQKNAWKSQKKNSDSINTRVVANLNLHSGDMSPPCDQPRSKQVRRWYLRSWGSEHVHVGLNTVWTCAQIPKLRRKILPPYSVLKMEAICSFETLVSYIKVNTALQPKRILRCSNLAYSMWKPKDFMN
jgi:hypothetical protein